MQREARTGGTVANVREGVRGNVAAARLANVAFGARALGYIRCVGGRSAETSDVGVRGIISVHFASSVSETFWWGAMRYSRIASRCGREPEQYTGRETRLLTVGQTWDGTAIARRGLGGNGFQGRQT
jgi:hypothetical protein